MTLNYSRPVRLDLRTIDRLTIPLGAAARLFRIARSYRAVTKKIRFMMIAGFERNRILDYESDAKYDFFS